MILALDSGALRCGIALIDYSDEPIYVHSEIFGVERNETPYQEYRISLMVAYSVKAIALVERYKPDTIVAETLPAVGMGGIQHQLAATATTAFLASLINKGYAIDQIAASTVKKTVAGSGTATKVGVRNGVIKVFPSLDLKLRGNKTKSDEADAIAVALAFGKLKLKWKW